jgi:hypothetical protein
LDRNQEEVKKGITGDSEKRSLGSNKSDTTNG